MADNMWILSIVKFIQCNMREEFVVSDSLRSLSKVITASSPSNLVFFNKSL